MKYPYSLFKNTLMNLILISNLFLQVPLPIPIMVTLISLYLVIAPLVNSPEFIYLYAIIFMLCGFPIYYLLVYKKFQIPGVSMVTLFLQVLLEVAPTTWEEITW